MVPVTTIRQARKELVIGKWLVDGTYRPMDIVDSPRDSLRRKRFKAMGAAMRRGGGAVEQRADGRGQKAEDRSQKTEEDKRPKTPDSRPGDFTLNQDRQSLKWGGSLQLGQMITMAGNRKLSEAELLEETEGIYQKLFNTLPTRVECKSITAPENERIPFKANLAKAALLYRAVDITGAALDLVKKKRPTPALALIRCVFETAALLCLLYTRLQKVVETNKLGDINGFLNRVGVGGRSESMPTAPNGSKVKSIHISTAIDKLSKEIANLSKEKNYGSLTKEYGFICEFAHPNFLGALGSYGKLNKEQNIMDFSLDKCYETISEPNAYGLNMLAMSLGILTLYYEKLNDILPKFTEICEGRLKNKKTGNR